MPEHEGWLLVSKRGRPAMDHYFRDGKSLCERHTKAGSPDLKYGDKPRQAQGRNVHACRKCLEVVNA